MNITVKQIRAFLAVAQSGSFTVAATRLHLTQSAVSVLIGELEKQFGLRLFDRTTRLVQATDAGRDFHPVAEKVLADLAGALASSRDLVAKQRGRVAIAATPLMSSILLPKAIARYAALYPGISVVLKDTLAAQIPARVRDGEVDFGIGTCERSGREISTEPLLSDTLVLICPAAHALARQDCVAWAELAEHPMIALTRDNSVGQLVSDSLAQAGVAVRVAYELSFLSTVVAMVDAGLGVAVLPSYARPLTQRYRIEVRPLVAPEVRREISFLTRQGRSLSAAASSLKNFLEDYVKGVNA